MMVVLHTEHMCTYKPIVYADRKLVKPSTDGYITVYIYMQRKRLYSSKKNCT